MTGVRQVIVAIDGPAGAGKSTLAARIAARFHLLNLETGAMYRAFALKALRSSISPEDPEKLAALSSTTSIRLKPSQGSNQVFLDDEDVSGLLREPAITDAASQVSVHPAIRAWMVGLQRSLGENGGVVMEGRDIGTVVFPDADVKIFLDAKPEVRGQRRFEQIEGSSVSAAQAPDSVIQELRERDYRDRHRAQSPLRPAPDAVIIDSTHLSLEQVVEKVSSIIDARIATPVSSTEP